MDSTKSKSSGNSFDVIDGAEAHRGVYRGNDLTEAFDSGAFSAHVADGSFRDIFPGDYITKDVTVSAIVPTEKTFTCNVRFIIADLDVALNRACPVVTAHHVAIVPQKPPFLSYMNPIDTNKGGYAMSYMNRIVMPAFARVLSDAFGASHLLKCNSEESGSGIADSESGLCRLMTLSMVFGQKLPAYALSFPDKDKYMDGVQLAGFKLNPALQGNGIWYWLSDTDDRTDFAYAGDCSGFHAFAGGASTAIGVRPFALLI